VIDADNVLERFGPFVAAKKKVVTQVTLDPIRFLEAEDVVTTDGVVRVQPGDYHLALDGNGNPYPIEASEFERTYEVVGGNG
jgi:hypothetical protein